MDAHTPSPAAWEQFERDVGFALRLLPDTIVRENEVVGGKNADLVLEQQHGFGEARVYVVECKYHARRLTHETVTKIWSSYSASIGAGKADALLLVTANGVVANARRALEGLPFFHVTLSDLLDRAFSANRLVAAARDAFEAEGLAAYYQPTNVFPLDLEFAARHYDRYYGDFTDFCLENLREITALRVEDKSIGRLWSDYQRLAISSDEPPPDFEVVARAVRERSTRLKSEPLAKLVDSWLDLEKPLGLAVLGSYGTGKSTFARFLVARQAARYQAGESYRIPLLIELRHFGTHQDIGGLISHTLINGHGVRNASFDTFRRLNSDGKLLLVLDGFDEMKEGMSREALLYNFAEINALLVGRAKIVLCGRPTVFEDTREQRLCLASGEADVFHATGRYLQTELAPMPPDVAIRAMRLYVAANMRELKNEMEVRLRALEAELSQNEVLQDLLARPVHFPMLLKVLPKWTRPLRALSRTELYGTFINQTIAREMTREAGLSAVSRSDRLRFAADLATLMYRLGNARAIRYSAIDDQVVAPYQRAGEPLEVTRRKLVRACFLERKPPDVLFFPHKSFAEYLVAERLYQALAEGEPRTDDLAVTPTPEITSFLCERARVEHWKAALARPQQNTRILRDCFRAVRGQDQDPPLIIAPFKSALVAPGTLDSLTPQAVAALPEMTCFGFADALEHMVRSHEAVGDAAPAALHRIAEHGPDVAAVHAYRALRLLHPEEAQLFRRSSAGATRCKEWTKRGWDLSVERQGRAVADRQVLSEVQELEEIQGHTRKEQLVWLVGRYPGVTVRDAAGVLNSTRSYVARVARELERGEVLTRVGQRCFLRESAAG